MDQIFSFESLDVYQRALSLARKVSSMTCAARASWGWADQFRRAATSIVLNVAEGSGRWHPKDKRNFYFIARGSVFECIPLIELGTTAGEISKEQREELREDCRAVAQMLTKLIQSTTRKTNHE